MQTVKEIDFEKFTDKSLLFGHAHGVETVDICEKRNLLASGSEEWTVKLWNLENNSEIRTYSQDGCIRDIVFSNDGNLLAFGGEIWYKIWLVDIKDLKNQYLTVLCGHSYNINRIRFFNNSQHLISASADRTVRIWNCQSGKETFNLKLNSRSAVNSVAINADDTVIAANSDNGMIRIWNLKSQHKFCSHHVEGQGIGIQFSNNQKMLVSSSKDGVVYLWSLGELTQNQLVLIRKFKVGSWKIQTVLFSPCSRYILFMCLEQSSLKIFNSQTGEVVKEFKFNKQKYSSCYGDIAISKNMDIIAFCEDTKVAVLRMK